MREKACMSNGKKGVGEEEDGELRRGPWTFEEDTQLVDYIAHHGEGQWNMLAKLSGLKRTGKSCRLRWLNYLKPDVKRGNLTPQEQLLILHLHSTWGNRWSKIARHLPGRTDNEIKNYWRTRAHKHARQLRIESNSNDFLDTIRRLWTPRLFQKMDQTSYSIFTSPSSPALSATPCPPLSSSSPTFMINSTSHPGETETPYSETAESTDFSSDYSKIALLLQNQDYPSSFLQNDTSLKNSTLNGTCFEENNDNRYDMWDFNPSSSSALETYDISEIESHLAGTGSNWETADTLWNI